MISYPGTSNDTTCMIVLKVINGIVLFGQLVWSIIWTIDLGMEVATIIFVPNVFIAAWSALYLFVPALASDATFKLASKIVSFVNIAFTLLMVYAIFGGFSFALYALIFVFYVGWIGMLNSITLLICLYVDNGSSPSLYQIMTEDYRKTPQKNMFYYVLDQNMKNSAMMAQPLKMNSSLPQMNNDINC